MPLLRAHPAPAAVVLAAFAALSWVFLFARPEYRPHEGRAFSGSSYPAAAHGWTWSDGLPGDGVEGDAAEPLLAHVTRAELAPARRAAAHAGIDPASVRPLRVARYASGESGFAAILAARGAAGRTCLGFVVPGRGTSFVCPQRQQAFAIATALPVQRSAAGAGYGMFLLGIASGGVRGATVVEHTAFTADGRIVRRPLAQAVFARSGGWWGTFTVTLNGDRPWQAEVVLRGEHGRLGTLPIRLSGPGSRLFVGR